jgi:hypothetical protein
MTQQQEQEGDGLGAYLAAAPGWGSDERASALFASVPLGGGDDGGGAASAAYRTYLAPAPPPGRHGGGGEGVGPGVQERLDWWARVLLGAAERGLLDAPSRLTVPADASALAARFRRRGATPMGLGVVLVLSLASPSRSLVTNSTCRSYHN